MSRHVPDQIVTDPQVALSYLKEGNQRFASGQLMPKDYYKESLEIVKSGQKPFAGILTCSDSRTPPEIFFDQGIGNIFVCRNAGNFADDTACGSLDFAAGVLGVKVIAVIGHNECGAVINAAKGTSGLPNELQNILGQIQKNLKGVCDADKADANKNGAAVKANVLASVERIKSLKMVKDKGVLVVGGHYDIGTGVVAWY